MQQRSKEKELFRASGIWFNRLIPKVHSALTIPGTRYAEPIFSCNIPSYTLRAIIYAILTPCLRHFDIHLYKEPWTYEVRNR